MGNDSSKDANSETISSVSSKVTNSKQSNFTEEEIQLGAKLENLCKNIKPMASSICKIFKVTWTNGRDVAVKQIPHVEGSGTLFDYMTREWKLQKQLDQENKNVLKLEAVGCTSDYKYLVLELCESSLDNVWSDEDEEKYKGELPSDLQVLHEIACGLAFIHSNNMVHRDIKPQNILISYPEDGRVWIKVADFGCAKPTKPTGSCSISKEFAATTLYASPETIDWQKDAQIAREKGLSLPPRVNNKTDVFSAGIVFFEFITRGVHPFGSIQQMIKSNIYEGNPENFERLYGFLSPNNEADLVDLIKSMIHHDQKMRPSMEEVKKKLEQLLSLKS